MPKSILTVAAAFVGGFVAIVSGLLVYQHLNAPPAKPENVPALLWPNPKSIAQFELENQDSGRFDHEAIEGKWTFWYFGYTHCPDACPTAMTAMSNIFRALRTTSSANDVQFVFVSVDPKRDTLPRLKQYVEFFDPTFIAVTGDDRALQKLTGQFGILYVLGEADDEGNYLVDHTSGLLLTDPEARLVGLFRQPHEVDDIVRQFKAIRTFIDEVGSQR